MSFRGADLLHPPAPLQRGNCKQLRTSYPFHKGGLLIVVLCLLLAAGCTSVRFGEETEQEAMMRLQERLTEDPGDAEALRDMGVLHLRADRYTEAYDHLKKAFARHDDDPETLFYLGMASEMVGKRQTALRLYGRYAEASRLSPYRRRMEGRYRWLLRVMAREEMQRRLAQEDERGGDRSPRIVAVFPLVYQGASEQYAPLGSGLSEMISVDLAQVGRLRVVERVRLQALMAELELAQSAYVDPATAPRAGRLLGAGRVVGGSYNVLAEEALRLDAALADAGRYPRLESRTGALSDLFRLEKEVVFRLIDEMDIELTPEERRAIEEVPTRNLQAFLAYSRGLEEEGSGLFAAAAASYQRAAELDPNFQEAAARAEAAAGLEAMAGSTEEALDKALDGEPFSTSSIDLLQRRMRLLNGSIGFLFFPGDEARQPASEAADAVREGLPGPPAPPPRGN